MVGKIGISFLLVFFGLLYFHNATADIFGGDTGDLVTSALVGGVAHPPGYPLFLLFGRLLGALPIPLLPVTKVALVSVISSVISLFLIYKIASLFEKNIYIRLLTPLVVGLTYLFWLYAEIPEVFALNTCISLGVIFSSLKFTKTREFKYLLLGAFLFGLGLSNHHTVIFTLFFCIVSLWNCRKELPKFGRKLFLVPVVGLLGLVPYLYLLWASATNPPVNWNNIHSLDGLVRHFFRTDYGTFSAGVFRQPDSGSKLIILKTYFESLLKTLTIPVLIISLIGIGKGIAKERSFAISAIIVFIVSGPLFTLYSGFPIADYFVQGIAERFYLLSFIIFLLFFPFGVRVILVTFLKVFSKKVYAHILISVFALIPMLLFIANFSRTDLSKTQIGTDFATAHLLSLPKNSVLILSGDTRAFNTWYVYYVLGIRNDIQLIQHGEFAIKNKILDEEKNEIQIKKEMNSADLFLNAVLSMSTARPIFSNVKFKIPDKNYKWLPVGMNYRLYPIDEMPSRDEYAKLILDSLKPVKIPYVNALRSSEKALILRSIPPYYSAAMGEIGDAYFITYTDPQSAQRFYDFAKAIDPMDVTGYLGAARVALLYNKCDEAENNAKKAIELLPVTPDGYSLWYRAATECYKDQKRIKDIEEVVIEKFNISRQESHKFLKRS